MVPDKWRSILAWRRCEKDLTADLWVWRHCKKSLGRRKLILSPDTDVGLSEIAHIPYTEIIVQLNNTCESVQYLSINDLLTALQNDTDLSQLPPCTRLQALQSLYVDTGCDYTSFFCWPWEGELSCHILLLEEVTSWDNW